MRAPERLYLTASKDEVVGHGNTRAAFLLCGEGEEVPVGAVELAEAYLSTKGADDHAPDPAEPDPADGASTDAGEAGSEGAAPERPSNGASRAAWADYATELGLEPGDLKRAELIDLVDGAAQS